MRFIKSILFMVMSLFILSGCETYSDPTVEYGPIFPLSGEWRVRVKDAQADTLMTKSMYVVGTYNTANNDTDQMWIRVTTNMVGGIGTLRGKIACDVPGLTFSATNAADASVTTGATFSITEAKITLKAITMPSGEVADKIAFKYTTSKLPGRVFLFEGYRRTLWPEDETYLTF